MKEERLELAAVVWADCYHVSLCQRKCAAWFWGSCWLGKIILGRVSHIETPLKPAGYPRRPAPGANGRLSPEHGTSYRDCLKRVLLGLLQ
jgi:hypothetical protein